MAGKQIFKTSPQVPLATTREEAVNLGQVKDLINRYMKDPVRVATTTELTGTYADNVLTLDSAVTQIDGVTLAENDAVLVKDQLDKNQNGVYIIDATGAILTRRADFEEGIIILNNTFVNVMEGTGNGDTRWTIISDGTLTVGTNNISFVKDIDTAEGVHAFKGTITGDDVTTSFQVAHGLNLSDPESYIIAIKDNAKNNIIVDHYPTLGNEANSITLTFDEAPTTAESFKVYILGLE